MQFAIAGGVNRPASGTSQVVFQAVSVPAQSPGAAQQVVLVPVGYYQQPVPTVHAAGAGTGAVPVGARAVPVAGAPALAAPAPNGQPLYYAMQPGASASPVAQPLYVVPSPGAAPVPIAAQHVQHVQHARSSSRS